MQVSRSLPGNLLLPLWNATLEREQTYVNNVNTLLENDEKTAEKNMEQIMKESWNGGNYGALFNNSAQVRSLLPSTETARASIEGVWIVSEIRIGHMTGMEPRLLVEQLVPRRWREARGATPPRHREELRQLRSIPAAVQSQSCSWSCLREWLGLARR